MVLGGVGLISRGRVGLSSQTVCSRRRVPAAGAMRAAARGGRGRLWLGATMLSGGADTAQVRGVADKRGMQPRSRCGSGRQTSSKRRKQNAGLGRQQQEASSDGRRVATGGEQRHNSSATGGGSRELGRGKGQRPLRVAGAGKQGGGRACGPSSRREREVGWFGRPMAATTSVGATVGAARQSGRERSSAVGAVSARQEGGAGAARDLPGRGAGDLGCGRQVMSVKSIVAATTSMATDSAVRGWGK